MKHTFLLRWVFALFAAALVFGAVCRTAARADTYAPVTLSAAEILAKNKLAEGKLVPGKYVSITHWTIGGVASIDTKHFDGDDYFETFTTEQFTNASGSYQGQLWSQNANGMVRRHSGFHAHDLNAEGWLHPDDPQYKVRVLGLTQGTPADYVIEVNPKGGLDEQRYYNAQTFLLDQSVVLGDDRYRRVSAFSDYRTVFGKTIPFAGHTYDGWPENEETWKMASFDRAPDDTTSMLVPSNRPLFDLPRNPVTLPARFTANGIVVRAMVGGRGLDFILDSGTSILTIDPTVARTLGLKIYGRRNGASHGDADNSLAVMPALSLGPLAMHDVTFTTTRLRMYAEDSLIVGLLGYDMFASAVIGIDFKKRTVTFFSRDAFVNQSQGVIPVPVQIDDGVPRVPVSLENIRGSFLLDTGDDFTTVFKPFLDRLPDAHREKGPWGISVGVSSYVRTSSYLVNDLAFGPISFDRAEVSVPESNDFGLLDYDGMIGRNQLEDYIVYFDYANGMVYLRANP